MFAEISGTMGDFVFRKSRNGETIVSLRPRKSNTPPSDAQQAQRERLKQAHEYARAALADPTLSALYEKLAAKEGKSPYLLAHSDYLNGKDLFSG
jgi:hypothetical protein